MEVNTKPEIENETELSQKFVLMKKRLRVMEEETQILASDLAKERRRVSRLNREKTFLLDRILDYEDALNEQAAIIGGDMEGDPPTQIDLREGAGIQLPAETQAAVESATAGRPGSPPSKKMKLLGEESASTSASHYKWSARPSVADEKQYLSQFNLQPGEAGPCLAINTTAVDEGGSNSSEPQTSPSQVQVQPCKSKAMKGKKYCAHHIPLDPSSGAHFCNYVDEKGARKRCWLVVAAGTDPAGTGYCALHRKMIV